MDLFIYTVLFFNQFQADISLGQRIAVFKAALKESGAVCCNGPTQCF